MTFNTNLQSNVIALVKELEEKGYLQGDTIIYDESEETIIKALLDKYIPNKDNNN